MVVYARLLFICLFLQSDATTFLLFVSLLYTSCWSGHSSSESRYCDTGPFHMFSVACRLTSVTAHVTAHVITHVTAHVTDHVTAHVTDHVTAHVTAHVNSLPCAQAQM